MENGSKWNEKTGKCWRAARERNGGGEGGQWHIHRVTRHIQGDGGAHELDVSLVLARELMLLLFYCSSFFFSICSALIALFSLFQALKSSHLTFHFEQVITSRYLPLNCHKYCKCGKHDEYIFWLSSFDLFICIYSAQWVCLLTRWLRLHIEIHYLIIFRAFSC